MSRRIVARRWFAFLPVLLGLWIGARERLSSHAPAAPAPTADRPALTPETAPPAGRTRAEAPPTISAEPVGPLGDPARRAQIEAVIASMDRTGHPPADVAQGGRKGGPRGVFDNAGRTLPARPRGYYTETDVWPHHGPRGAERLVFGREGEVYYTADHYRTFVKVR